jgi:pyruvate/2-oxoglutarate dehydrogenase complex dihydrolipoamide dehydrogenase (E3) component/uncharacterized membrane protein YdjX (TVP38/TMEM64 family)
MKKISKLLIILIIGAGVFFLFRYFKVNEFLKVVLNWLNGLGLAGFAVYILLYVLATVLFLPGSVLTLGAGFLFGVPLGLVLVSISATLGATAAFLVGKYFARDWVAHKVANSVKFKAIDEAVAREGWKIVLLTRLSPVFPFNLLNYSFGLTQVRLKHYFLASWIGMLPGTVMYVYLGSLASNLATLGGGARERTNAEWLLYGLGLTATIAIAIFVTRMARKALEQTLLNPEKNMAEPKKKIELEPWDKYNQELVSQVHPGNWMNPELTGRYNLVVIGAGTAGLVTAAGAAGLGAKVALIERNLMGGDCLNVGCVPSKGLIRVSRLAAELARSKEFGIEPGKYTINFSRVMEGMRAKRARISSHDSAQRFREMGIDVFFGHARFKNHEIIEVAGKELRFKKAVIATGARAMEPPIPGLKEAGFLTNETVFNLTKLPRRLAVIGGGPIGCELSQVFARLGSKVSILEMAPQFLIREDRDAADILSKTFQQEGIDIYLSAAVKKVIRQGAVKTISMEHDAKEKKLTVDQILIGAGRQANVEGMDLEKAAVQYDKFGVKVNDQLQTTNKNIYAAGDICMMYKFTHAADFAARIVIQNALFHGRKKLSALTIPWCTYTEPEIAHVGLYEKEAKEQGMAVATFTRFFKDVDRAILDGAEEGFVKIHVKKGTDKIIGGTIVGQHAGDMISELSVAVVNKIGLGRLANVIHPYPTVAEAIRQAADMYNRNRLTPFIKRLFKKWLSWTR